MDRPDQDSTPRRAEGLGRRQFLRGIAATGAVAGAGSLLAACGGGSSSAGPEAGHSGQPLLTARRQPQAGPHRRLQLGHPRPAQEPDLPGHLPAPVALPAPCPARRPGAGRVRAGGVDHPARVAVQLDHPAAAGRDLPRRQGPHRRRRHLHVPAGRIDNDFTGKFGLGPIDLKNTKAVDKLTVQVKMTKPFASFAEQLAAFWYNLYIAPVGFNPAKPVGHRAVRATRASRPASAACSPGTRTTGSRACPTRTP